MRTQFSGKPMNLHSYILENGEVKACDIIEAAQWREKNDSQVALTEIEGLEKTIVSTVFLALDLSLGRAKVPVVFETAVFTGDGDVSIKGRYCTLKEARDGHVKACKELNKHIAKNNQSSMEP
jgi:hypothetical protein